MPQLLIRNVPIETKQALQMRAIKNKRTQNAEVLSILNEALFDDRKAWIDVLGDAKKELGGIELELPVREPARNLAFKEQ